MTKRLPFVRIIMHLTRTADYATRVMIHLAAWPPRTRVNRDTLAEWAEVPPEFLGKVLQALTRSRLIQSHRGVMGGYELARPSASITLLDIVEAIEGPVELNVCLSEKAKCGRQWWCGAHRVWAEAQAALKTVLSGASLDQMAARSMANGLCGIKGGN